MTKITAIEDIDAFWRNLGNSIKLYKVKIGNKIYKNMELTYSELNEGTFTFTERKGAK